MAGSMFIGEIEQKPNISFEIIDDFKTYIIAIDVEYDAGEVIFTGWLHRLNTPQIL